MPKDKKINKTAQERKKQAKQKLKDGKFKSMKKRVEYIEQLLGI